jgi:hypothetical protein
MPKNVLPESLLCKDRIPRVLRLIVVNSVLRALGTLHRLVVDAFQRGLCYIRRVAARALDRLMRSACACLGRIKSACHKSPLPCLMASAAAGFTQPCLYRSATSRRWCSAVGDPDCVGCDAAHALHFPWRCDPTVPKGSSPQPSHPARASPDGPQPAKLAYCLSSNPGSTRYLSESSCHLSSI